MTNFIFPLGIPRVPFKERNEIAPKWIDIYSRLYKERIIFLFELLDHDQINTILAMLLYLDLGKIERPIYFYINSIGGSISSGIALYDMMKYIQSDIITICIGITGSISSIILANGKSHFRMILPHSRVILSQPRTEFYGQASDIVIESERIMRLRRLIIKIYAEQTNQVISKIARDVNYDCSLSSVEALNYGIVDQILY